MERHLVVTLMAAVLVACDADPTVVSRNDADLILPTDSVAIECTDNLADGQAGACLAQGYDANGQSTTTSATWTNLSPSLISIVTSGVGIQVTAGHMVSGTATVRATIEGVSAEAEIDVYLSSLTASISGEEAIQPATMCSWDAVVSGGSTPYGYYWTRTGSLQFSTQPYFETLSAGNFTITLTVTDDRGTVRQAQLPVTVDDHAAPCPER